MKYRPENVALARTYDTKEKCDCLIAVRKGKGWPTAAFGDVQEAVESLEDGRFKVYVQYIRRTSVCTIRVPATRVLHLEHIAEIPDFSKSEEILARMLLEPLRFAKVVTTSIPPELFSLPIRVYGSSGKLKAAARGAEGREVKSHAVRLRGPRSANFFKVVVSDGLGYYPAQVLGCQLDLLEGMDEDQTRAVVDMAARIAPEFHATEWDDTYNARRLYSGLSKHIDDWRKEQEEGGE